METTHTTPQLTGSSHPKGSQQAARQNAPRCSLGLDPDFYTSLSAVKSSHLTPVLHMEQQRPIPKAAETTVEASAVTQLSVLQ